MSAFRESLSVLVGSFKVLLLFLVTTIFASYSSSEEYKGENVVKFSEFAVSGATRKFAITEEFYDVPSDNATIRYKLFSLWELGGEGASQQKRSGSLKWRFMEVDPAGLGMASAGESMFDIQYSELHGKEILCVIRAYKTMSGVSVHLVDLNDQVPTIEEHIKTKEIFKGGNRLPQELYSNFKATEKLVPILYKTGVLIFVKPTGEKLFDPDKVLSSIFYYEFKTKKWARMSDSIRK